MGRKKTTESEGVSDQATGVQAGTEMLPSSAEAPVGANGVARPKGPPRLNPPRYWVARLTDDDNCVFIQQFRSLRAALKAHAVTQRMLAGMGAGRVVVLKVKLAYPVPTPAPAVE